MANNQTPKLRAFVRIDGSGRVVSGTPVLQASKPKVGTWREIPLYYRGEGTTTTTTTAAPSTTTTTTATPSTTTTTTTAVASFSYSLATGTSSFFVCNGSNRLTLYAGVATLNIGVQLYTDSGLTTPYNTSSPFFVGLGNGIGSEVWEVVNGQITALESTC